MSKKLFRSIILLITFAVLLAVAVSRLDILFAALKAIVAILKPFLVGLIIAYILNRPTMFFHDRFIRKMKGKRRASIAQGISVAIVYLLFIGILVLVFALLIPRLADSIAQFADNFDLYSEKINEFVNNLILRLRLDDLSVDIPALIQDNMSNISELTSKVATTLANVVASTITALSNFFIGLVVSVFMLVNKEQLLRQIHLLADAYLPDKAYKTTIRIARQTNITFNHFVSGQLLDALIFGCLCFVGMTIFRFDYALPISLIIGLTNIVPIIGPLLGTIPCALLLLLISPVKAFWFVVFIIVIQQIDGNLIYPKIVGNKTGLPALWMLFAIIIGGKVFGIWGVLLGVPICAVLYALIKENAQQRAIRRKREKVD